LLKLEWAEAAPCVRLHPKALVLQLRPGASEAKRAEVLEAWLREQVRAALPAFLAKWQPVLGVQVAGVYVQRMKTKWGACNPARRTIRLNTDLARKPPECLEYIVVHELAHLREPHHGEGFQRLMSEVMPQWQAHRRALNRLPLRHEDWGY
jgi:predicted metal-dependent hydrolase